MSDDPILAAPEKKPGFLKRVVGFFGKVAPKDGVTDDSSGDSDSEDEEPRVYRTEEDDPSKDPPVQRYVPQGPAVKSRDISFDHLLTRAKRTWPLTETQLSQSLCVSDLQNQVMRMVINQGLGSLPLAIQYDERCYRPYDEEESFAQLRVDDTDRYWERSEMAKPRLFDILLANSGATLELEDVSVTNIESEAPLESGELVVYRHLQHPSAYSLRNFSPAAMICEECFKGTLALYDARGASEDAQLAPFTLKNLQTELSKITPDGAKVPVVVPTYYHYDTNMSRDVPSPNYVILTLGRLVQKDLAGLFRRTQLRRVYVNRHDAQKTNNWRYAWEEVPVSEQIKNPPPVWEQPHNQPSDQPIMDVIVFSAYCNTIT